MHADKYPVPRPHVVARVVVSACQQCEQVLAAAVRKAKLPVRVMDVSQLLLEAMG